MTPFQKAGEGSVSLMESSFLWTIWQQVAPLFPSFCLNGHADSDMIFHIKGAKRSVTGCKTSINVIRSCVASRPCQHCPLSSCLFFPQSLNCANGVTEILCLSARCMLLWGVRKKVCVVSETGAAALMIIKLTQMGMLYWGLDYNHIKISCLYYWMNFYSKQVEKIMKLFLLSIVCRPYRPICFLCWLFRHCILKCFAGVLISMPIRRDTCLCVSKCIRCSHNTPAPPLGLVPSAQLQRANYSRQSLLSPHSFFTQQPLCALARYRPRCLEPD